MKRFWPYALVAVITAIITYKLLPPRIEYKEKLVTQVQERVITRTRIIERPDGTKETIIDSDTDRKTKTVSEKSTKPANKDLTVFAAGSVYSPERSSPVYSVGISKELLLGIKVGVYGRTDKELGLLLSYDF